MDDKNSGLRDELSKEGDDHNEPTADDLKHNQSTPEKDTPEQTKT